MNREAVPNPSRSGEVARRLIKGCCPVAVSQCGNVVRCENRALICHSSPDVKGSFLPQPEEPFNSPIRSRPCPGRLFFAPSFHAQRLASEPAKRGTEQNGV